MVVMAAPLTSRSGGSGKHAIGVHSIAHRTPDPPLGTYVFQMRQRLGQGEALVVGIGEPSAEERRRIAYSLGMRWLPSELPSDTVSAPHQGGKRNCTCMLADGLKKGP